MPEIWKPIPDYESFYEVSNLGRVKRICKGGRAQIGRILSPAEDACGYLRVLLCRAANDHSTHKVHRLVLSAFLGPRGPEWKTNHKNRIRNDNRLSNLEYLSHADNIRYSSLSYARPGSTNPRATLSESQVIKIRALYKKGSGLTQLAKQFSSNKHTIYDVVNRRSWKHL